MNKQTGFSLIEISAVIAIAAVVMTGSIQGLRVWITKQNIDTNSKRIETIQLALNDYADKFGHLPCPANPALPRTNAQYARAMDCANTGSGGARTASANPKTPLLFTRIGAVPTRTLNLPDAYFSDAKDNAFTYAVSEPAAIPSVVSAVKTCVESGKFYKFSDSTCVASAVPNDTVASVDELGTIDIVNETGSSSLNNQGEALYALIGHGQDRKGAYTNEGAQSLGCGTFADGKDFENCDRTDSEFLSMPRSTMPGVNYFDDFISYGTKLFGGTVVSGGGGGSGEASRTYDRQYFASSGTWTKPSGFPESAMATIQCWGGGGGGSSGDHGGGGGSGYYNEKQVLLSSLSDSVNVTIGAGGAAGSGSGLSGGGYDGSASSFGAYLSSSGGSGARSTCTGGYTSYQCPSHTGAAGGGWGESGSSSIYYKRGGNGGNAPNGGGSGGYGGIENINGTPGAKPGGGGGGGSCYSCHNPGGAGAPGACIVTVYY